MWGRARGCALHNLECNFKDLVERGRSTLCVQSCAVAYQNIMDSIILSLCVETFVEPRTTFNIMIVCELFILFKYDAGKP